MDFWIPENKILTFLPRSPRLSLSLCPSVSLSPSGLLSPCSSRITFALPGFFLKVETHKSLKSPAGEFSPTADRFHTATFSTPHTFAHTHTHTRRQMITLSLASSPLIVSDCPTHTGQLRSDLHEARVWTCLGGAICYERENAKGEKEILSSPSLYSGFINLHWETHQRNKTQSSLHLLNYALFNALKRLINHIKWTLMSTVSDVFLYDAVQGNVGYYSDYKNVSQEETLKAAFRFPVWLIWIL